MPIYWYRNFVQGLVVVSIIISELRVQSLKSRASFVLRFSSNVIFGIMNFVLQDSEEMRSVQLDKAVKEKESTIKVQEHEIAIQNEVEKFHCLYIFEKCICAFMHLCNKA